MAIEVVPLTKSDIPEAVDIILAAFADDPYFKWVFDPNTYNKQRNQASLTARCIWGINNALFYIARDMPDSSTSHNFNNNSNNPPGPILGVSCWLPPSPSPSPTSPESNTQSQSWTSYTDSLLLSTRQLLNNILYLGRGGLNTHRYSIWKAKQHEAQSRIWTNPSGYYFCNMVAVSPRAQGRGVGKKLFEVVMERADREGVPCYLESSKLVPNVGIYGRWGFELRMEMECVDDDGNGDGDGGGEGNEEGEGRCMLYCMVREPRRVE